MKKTKKILSLIVVFVLLISASVVSFSADTIYIVNGYSYSVVNNTSISLVDWDHEQPNLSVPDMLANRYFISVSCFTCSLRITEEVMNNRNVSCQTEV